MECRRLVEVLGELTDPRKKRGKRYPFQGVLCLVCVAMLCDCDTYSAVAQWGRDHADWACKELGFTPGRTPCAAALYYILRKLDRAQLETKLGAWAEEILASIEQSGGKRQAVAGDGKTLRGSQKQGAPGAHILSVVSHALGLTLTQTSVGDKTNEIGVIKEVLEAVVLQGRVVTVDALHTQRETAAKILERGGDYMMIAKKNQPELLADIAREFAEVNVARLSEGYSQAQTIDLEHGRIETRRILVSTRLEEYLDWPGVRQVFQIRRSTVEKKTGERHEEFAYGLTSLRADKAGAEEILAYNRGHWTIENRSHHVRDVTFDEDRCQTRVGSVPQALAALRNALISLVRVKGKRNIAAARRRFAAHPREALSTIGLAPDF